MASLKSFCPIVGYVALILTVVLLNPSLGRAADDALLQALSSRHFKSSTADLEKAAGSQDALVQRLLELRTQETPPFAGIRAEKILLNYADRSDVQAALQSDIESTRFPGLARIIAANIDAVSHTDTRRKLAELAIARSSRETDFAPLARNLRNSTDSNVSTLAKQAFSE